MAEKRAVKAVAKKPKAKASPKPLTTAQKLDAIGIAAICERVTMCHFLQKIADDCGVSRWALVKWLGSDDNAALYACAREAQADTMAEDMLAIADDGTRDTYIDAEGNERTDQDVIARSRLRVDARKWLAGKMAPKKYGDKIDVSVDAIVTTQTEDQRLARIAELQAKLLKK